LLGAEPHLESRRRSLILAREGAMDLSRVVCASTRAGPQKHCQCHDGTPGQARCPRIISTTPPTTSAWALAATLAAACPLVTAECTSHSSFNPPPISHRYSQANLSSRVFKARTKLASWLPYQCRLPDEDNNRRCEWSATLSATDEVSD